MTRDETFDDLLTERLDHAKLPAAAKRLVAAAMLGDHDLAAVLGGAPPSTSPAAAQATTEPAPAYLTGIEVAGFRGIGPPAKLLLKPGPGLTLVTGRNGSGKSSFAEAAELALTGDNKRWSGRVNVWRDGWRNLHADGTAYLKVGLAIDGKRPATAERHWDAGADLAESTTFLQVTGEPRAHLAELGWDQALELYRPFLSYSELGGLLTGRPSEMYDSLQRILGLDGLIAMETRLKDARKQLTDAGRRADDQLPALRARLAEHPDPRARAAEQALDGRDLDRLDRLTFGDGTADGDEDRSLRRLAGLTLPNPSIVDSLVERYAEAQARIAKLRTNPAVDAGEIAALLRGALSYQKDHVGDACPVCGGRPLDHDWAAVARNQLVHLDQLARELREARATVAAALEELRGLLPRRADALAGTVADIDPAKAREAWQRWHDLLDNPDPDRFADDTHAGYADLTAAVDAVRQAGEQALRSRQRVWQPVADEIRRWVQVARESAQAHQNAALLKRALTWLADVGQEIRDARLAPLAKQSAEIWDQLRQESSVDLGRIQLASTGNRRHVKLDVTIDGESGSALGVMSQGELHALALALFLPRATVPESPFRFLVIDDPVQSMDPAKVYGLARVLAEVAKDRQVVVFTHDDRLAQAVRLLQLPARILEVTRREGSAVSVTTNQDPVTRYLDDAWAIAKTDRLPEQARAVVVAGFVRSAVEAACHEAVRTRRVRVGVPHRDVEAQLAGLTGLRSALALALLDDPRRVRDLTERVRRLDPHAPALLRAVNGGAHGTYQERLTHLVRDGRRLADKVRRS